MASLYEAVANTITLTTAIVDFDEKFYNEWSNKTIDPQKMAKIIRQQGVKPIEESNSRPAVLSVINGAFPLGSPNDENNYFVLQVQFNKPFDQIFVDTDEGDFVPDGNIIPGYNFDKGLKVIQANIRKKIETPLSSIITPQQIGNTYVQGVYVHDVKPNEILDIRIVPWGGDFKKGKRV